MNEGNLLARGISVVEALSVSPHLSTETISHQIRVPRSTVYRILCVLEELGYVTRDKDGHHDAWSLGLKFLKVSAGLLSRMEIKSIVRDSLVGLADDTKEIVQLAVLDGHQVVIVENLQRHPSIVAVAPVGERLQVNICASGLVLAAHGEEHILDSIIGHGELDSHTEFTVTDATALKHLLATVRQQGYAVDDQYYAIGHRCIGAPVYDYTGHVVAAINISGHIRTITNERVPALAELVVQRAQEASARLGYEPGSATQLDGATVRRSEGLRPTIANLVHRRQI
jgi:IclR family transcriptional regulator, KDG regulon repressor